MCHTLYEFGCDHSINKGTRKINIPFLAVSWLPFGYYFRNFTYLQFSTHALQALCVWLRSGSGCRSLYCEKEVSLLLYIGLCWEGILLQLHAFVILRKRQTHGEFGCDRPIIKGTLHVEPFTFLDILSATIGGIWNFESPPFHACATHRVPV